MAGEGGEKGNLEYTPTWVVAAVCSVIVLISFTLERTIFYLGKVLNRKNRKPLLEALEKVKEELMLLGFISLLLSVFQGPIGHLCMPINFNHHMLPCKKEKEEIAGTSHYQIASFSGILGGKRHLLSGGSGIDHCTGKGKVQLLSQEALHVLHIFIFVLAIVHVLFSLFTIILGGAKIHEWERWEDSIGKDKHNAEQERRRKFTRVLEHSFIREHFKGTGKHSAILSWLHSFIKQFYGSLTKSDYITLRLGFIQMHCKGNPKFNFHKYMIRALEEDFKRVVGISWYLWILVVIFLFLNVHGWNAYFWMAFIPLILVLAVGTKLEHVISQLAHEVAEKHTAIEGDLVIQPSDDHFWFHRPRLVLHLVHFILFHNAFEIAVFFWILIMFGFHSCIMGNVGYIIPRLVIGVTVQLLCSYSTLPLYAIVTQMGSSFKPAIFDEHVQEGLVEWAQNAKKKGPASNTKGSSSAGSLAGIQLQNVGHKELANEEAIAGNSDPSNRHQETAPAELS
ncbi:hypothetical protein MRB53_035351 [Persea americana]|uniref:Uncharacterized protein n=1 Tax=Persea americana TaxID=3435 RepID=A0ACC2K4F7_PERAE|nr:hypothetical protein MRB53_035351 [Persea americana]